MLVNGTKLYYSVAGSPLSYTELTGLKEVPDMGAEPELVDNTALTDSYIYNEIGIGDPGSMEYTFRYDNSTATTAYRLIRAQEGVQTWFKEELYDGTTFEFTGTPSVRVSGGGVNDPQEFVVTVALQGSITITDPA